MKIVVSTDLFFTKQQRQSIVDLCSQCDSTFLLRYLDNDNRLSGEHFWDADKYMIFYLDVDDQKIDAFVQAMKQEDACLLIGEVDGHYNLKEGQKPFYTSEQALDWQGNLGLPYARRRDTRYPLKEAAHAAVNKDVSTQPAAPKFI